MKCANCGEPMKPADRVCRACRFMPETGRVLEVEPPRRAGIRAVLRPRDTGDRLGLWSRLNLGRSRAPHPMPRWLPVLLGVLPGFGHFARRQNAKGLAVLAIVGGLVAAGIFVATRNDLLLQVCLGFAAAIHAFSIMDLMSPFARQDVFNRLFQTAFALAALGALIYWPLMRALLPDTNRTVMVSPTFAPFYWIFELVTSVGFTVFAFLIFGLLAAIIGRMLTNPGTNR